MSDKYNEYLNNHINAVKACYKLLTGEEMKVENVNDMHDASKYSFEEYGAYDEFFYPSDRSRVGSDPERKRAFDYAWLHHQNTNKHHWQYWVLINDNEGIKALEIPKEYVIEMVSDWGAFAYLKKDGQHLIDWYKANKDQQIINPTTRDLVNLLVYELAVKIDEEFRKEEG